MYVGTSSFREELLLQVCSVQINFYSFTWKVLYPAMKVASLVRLCLPDPPTPTSIRFPPGLRITLKLTRDTFKKGVHVCTVKGPKNICVNLKKKNMQHKINSKKSLFALDDI